MLNLENKKKNDTKINILGLGLGSLVVSYLFRLRRGSIWSLILGGLNSFPLTSVLMGDCWDFHRSWKSLIYHRSFGYWGWLL